MLMILATVGVAALTADAASVSSPSCGLRPAEHLLVSRSNTGASSNYVLGGDQAAVGEFPWQVSIQEASRDRSRWIHSCGGAIIDEEWIFTAAHCVNKHAYDHVPRRVVFGLHNVTVFDDMVSTQEIPSYGNVFIHPLCLLRRLDFDYALIKLPRPLNFSGPHAHLSPICMPSTTDLDAFTDMECVVSGWGLTKHSRNPAYAAQVLQKLPVRVMKHEDCPWGDLNKKLFGVAVLTSRHICAATTRGEGSGICSGDSGGPLQCRQGPTGRWILAGVASFVRYCGSARWPSVYARIGTVLDWVERIKASVRSKA